MAYPVTFAALTTAQMSSLDQMFQIVGTLGVVPCTASGTNIITLTPSAGITPAISAYANYLQFSFVAASTSTGSVTLQVGSLAALPVFTASGNQAGSGNIAANALYVVAFNQNLNGGTGGWQIVAGPTVALSAALTSGRNRMINGAMDIDQRNEGAAVTIATQSSAFITDQTQCFFSGLAPNITAQRVAVTGLAGFVNGTQVSINSGAAGLGSQDYLLLEQRAEGINIADLSFGTSVAQAVSLGVWVNSSVGGNVGISLRNSGGARSYVSMTSTTAGTWTFCPVANIAGDSTGTWLTGAGQIGITYGVTMMAGSGWQTSSTNSWVAGNFISSSNQTNITTTSGATFIITGLSLEPGATINTFDRRPFPEELALCQRYYEKSYSLGTAVATATNAGLSYIIIQSVTNSATNIGGRSEAFKVTKSSTPTVTFYSPATGITGKAKDFANVSDVSCSSATVAGLNGFTWNATVATATTQINMGVQWTAEAGV